MQRPMMISKIHRATITAADLHYVGSITVDSLLMEAADLLPGQQVDVVDVTNGARLTTYVIPGEAGSGTLCINGATSTSGRDRTRTVSGTSTCITPTSKRSSPRCTGRRRR